LRAGLAQHAGHPILGYALGVLLLARGAYDEGWPLYEHRRAMPGGPPTPRFSFPEWSGGPVGSLLVLPEQGFGDQLMYARYLPVLRDRDVRVTLVTPPPAWRACSQPLADQVLARRRHDLDPGLRRLVLHRLPAPPDRRTPQRALPAGDPGGAGVGLMLPRQPQYRGQPRTLLTPDAMAPLLSLGRSLHPDDTGAGDFQATADLIKPLARVISVDTSVAHLAAAWARTPGSSSPPLRLALGPRGRHDAVVSDGKAVPAAEGGGLGKHSGRSRVCFPNSPV
jgi:hypothetical protein